MGRGSGALAEGLPEIAGERQEQVLRALLAGGAYEGGESTSGFYAVWGLSVENRRSKLPEELRLPDSRYGSALHSLEQKGLVEGKTLIGQTHMLWRLTPAGVEAAGNLAAV